MEEAEFVELNRFDPGSASRRDLETMLPRYAAVGSWATAREMEVLAAIDALEDGGLGPADVKRARTKCSTRKAKRAARTAQQLDKMPDTKAALERGEIGEEHADAAADAAERTSPEEADEALAGTAKKVPADRFRKRAIEWAGRKESDQATQGRSMPRSIGSGAPTVAVRARPTTCEPTSSVGPMPSRI